MASITLLVSRLATKKGPCFTHEAGSFVYQSGALLALLRVLLLKPLHSSFRIDDLLRSGKERMAIRANVDTDVTDRRTGLERITARAVNGRLSINWMNTLLHDLRLLTEELLT